MKNSTCLNSQIQNELIDMISIITIQKDFVNDIEESKLYNGG